MPKVEISEETLRASLAALRCYLLVQFGLQDHPDGRSLKVIEININNAERAVEELEIKLLSL